MARKLEPQQDNPFIEIGRLISEESYKREKKEIMIGNIAIDVLRKRDGEIVIGEVKKSSTFVKSATMQLAFYLKTLKESGVVVKGELLFPKEKKTIEVTLTQELEKELEVVEAEIISIATNEKVPERQHIHYCKNCGYGELCWS